MTGSLNEIFSHISYCWLWVILTSFACVFVSRLSGRTEDKCPTWQDKANMGCIWLAAIFCCMFFIILLLAGYEAHLMQIWGINK